MKNFTLFARDHSTETKWEQEIQSFQRGLGDFIAQDLAFIDNKRENWQEIIQQFDFEGKTRVLVIEENDFMPTPADLELVDDLIVYPFRMAEMMSKTRAHHMAQEKEELEHELEFANEAMAKTTQMLDRVLHAKTPRPHSGIKGVNVLARHLSGLKPGGDYFDIFESSKKDHINILLTDSSSYGVSSALLGMLISTSAKLASDTETNVGDWVHAIYEELKVTLGEQEHLSVFFGRLNKKDHSLHYQLFGSVEAFIVEKDGEVHPLDKHGSRLSAFTPPTKSFEKVIMLSPKDRIVLLTDGFVNGIGGEFSLQKIFHEKLEKEPYDLITELSYQIKSKLIPGETFPGEDCSAIVIDVENRGLRIAG
jgi:hypothetical protein